MLVPVIVLTNEHKSGNLKEKEFLCSILEYQFIKDPVISILHQIQRTLTLLDLSQCNNLSIIVTMHLLYVFVYSSSFNLFLYLTFILISTN